MNIDDPIAAAEARIKSDERQRSVVTDLLARAVAAALDIPGTVVGYLEKRESENLELLVRVVRDETRRLRQDFSKLSEEHERFMKTDFVELLLDGLRKARNLRAKERIVRLGKILSSAAEIGSSVSLDETEELMRVAVSLSDLDVAVLLEIYRAQSQFLKDNQSGRVNRESANEAWRDSPPRLDGIPEGEIQSSCATLQSFGLVARVERNDFKLGPNEIPYALPKRGAVFSDFVRGA